MEANEAAPPLQEGNPAAAGGLTRDEGLTNPIPTHPKGSMQFAAPVRPSDFLRAGRPAPQRESSMPSVVTELPEQIAAKVSFSPAQLPCARPRVPAAGVAFWG